MMTIASDSGRQPRGIMAVGAGGGYLYDHHKKSEEKAKQKAYEEGYKAGKKSL